MPKKAKCWSFTTGEKGSSVTVYEREPGGLLYARAFDRGMASGRGGYRRVSLEPPVTANAQRRTQWSKAAKAQAGTRRDARREGNTFARARAVPRRTVRRARRKRANVRTSGKPKCGCASSAARKTRTGFRLAEWEGFIRARTEGAINARGESVSAAERHPVRARMVQIDCLWLRWALAWAAQWREGDGRYLLRENPVRGFTAPAEANPKRPLASTDRYEALRAVSDQVAMEVYWDGSPPPAVVPLGSARPRLRDGAAYLGYPVVAVR